MQTKSESNSKTEIKTYTVYKHTAPNGKVYIGITSQKDVRRRWQYGYGYRSQERFARAIQKYGWGAFAHEVLFTGLTKEEAEQKEILLISQYKSTDPAHGYNIENGGNVFGSHSLETRQKISEAQLGPKNHMYGKPSPMRGKKATPEQVQKNRESHLGQPSFWKGKSLPEDAKEKLRKPKTEEHKRKLSEAKSVPVVCVETGQVFKSGKAAAEFIGISRGSIAHAVKGERKTAGGYHWQLAKEVSDVFI